VNGKKVGINEKGMEKGRKKKRKGTNMDRPSNV
jgi:hypothetical protein